MGLGPERQSMLLLHRARLALGVVQRPLVERDDALPRLLGELLAELDRLGEDDLFLGRQQGDLADLLEVHPDRVVDPDHVRGDGLQVLGGRLVHRLRIQLRRGIRGQGRRRVRGDIVGDDHDPDIRAVGRRRRGFRTQVQIVIVVVVALGDGDAGLGPGRAHAGHLGFFDVCLGASRSGQDGFDELLV